MDDGRYYYFPWECEVFDVIDMKASKDIFGQTNEGKQHNRNQHKW